MIKASSNGATNLESTITASMDRQTSIESRRPPRESKKILQRVKALQKVKARESVIRTVQPTGIIGIGGTGAMICSLREKLHRQQCSDEFTRTLVIDTDDASQAGSPKGVSFADRQFLHINPTRVRAITDNIKRHGNIAKQVGLDNPDCLAFHQNLVLENVQHAGQVRSYGMLATLADWLALRVALKRLIADLVGGMAALERQLASENRVLIRNQISIHLIFSIAGGTGSSMALPVAALLRDLTNEIPCEIIATIVCPSAFDSVLEGKHDQSKRVNANAYASLVEFEAARSGLLAREGIRLGVHSEDQCPVIGGLFNHLFVVGRYQADGKDLETLDAVYDTIALNLAGVIGTEIADRVTADEANEASLKRLSPDPVTKQPRYVNSLGAKAASLNAERITQQCAARQLMELMADSAIGSKAALQEVESFVDAWLGNPLPSDSIVIDPNSLANTIFRLCPAQPAAIAQGVFRVSRGRSRLYYRNRPFADRVKLVQRKFEQSQVAANEAKIGEAIASLDSQLQTSLKQMLHDQTRKHGWKRVVQDTEALEARFTAFADSCRSEADSQIAAAKGHVERLSEYLVPMATFLRGLFTSKQRQERIAALLQDAMSSALRHQIHRGLQRLFVSMLSTVTQQRHLAERQLAAAQAALETATRIAEATQAGKQLTTASHAELDLSTPQIDDQIYVDARFTNDAFLEQLALGWSCSKSAALRGIANKAEKFHEAMALAKEHFGRYLSEISVVDVLAMLLDDPKTAVGTMARLQHLLQGCQPLWQAESGQLGLEFSDSLMIGIPAASNPENRNRVIAAIDSLGPQRARANGQYSGNVAYVDTGDLTRIYAIRRVGGGCFHYLPDVRRAKLSYDQWNRHGGHSVHIFNAATVAKMPSLIPNDTVDEGELAFALAVAYGWIASRGAYWYDNLSSNEPGGFTCRLASQWNCLAYREQEFDTSSPSLALFVQSGRIAYQNRNDPEPSQRLGQGLEETYDVVMQNGEIIENVMAAFDALRTAAGDIRVVEDLERYCGELRKRTRANDTNYALVCQMVERLSFQANQLRSDNA